MMISHQMYLWDLICYIWRHHMHCKCHHIHYICNITTTVSVSSHPVFRCYHTLCMYDITPAVCVASYTLYEASHPHFMSSHHIIYDSTFTVFLTSLPQHWIHCICVITTTLVMIADQHFAWYHTHFMYDVFWTLPIVTSTLYELTPL